MGIKKKMRVVTLLILHQRMLESHILILFFMIVSIIIKRRSRRGRITYSANSLARHNLRNFNLRDLNLRAMVFENEDQCLVNTRMDRRAFGKLCELLKYVGMLTANRNTTVEEMTVSFLHIIGHNKKKRVMHGRITRSGETVSRNFYRVLHAVLRLHTIMLREAEPISADSIDDRWGCFKV